MKKGDHRNKNVSQQDFEIIKTMQRGGVKYPDIMKVTGFSYKTIGKIATAESYEHYKQRQQDYQREWKAKDKARREEKLHEIMHPEEKEPVMPGRIEAECGMTINDVVYQLVLINRSLKQLTLSVHALVEAWKPTETEKPA